MIQTFIVISVAAALISAKADDPVFLRRRLAPIDACSEQSGCLSVEGDGDDDVCDADGKRTVCITWNNIGGSCVKDTSDTISHACPVIDGVLNDAQNVKTEGWNSDNQICVTVSGGEDAVFGVKDGGGCSGAGDYTVASGITGTCSGPLTACTGGNTKECAWTFPTSECSSSKDDDADGGDDEDDGDTGGRTCFSSEDKVQLETGDLILFKNIKIGDSILSANREGEFSYSKVVFLPHGINNVTTTFVEIKTNTDRLIKMTRRHLLPLCNGELIVAQDVKTGSCLRTVDGDELVTTTNEVVVNGVYTAVTNNEFLVVNGFIASPFASPDGAKHGLFNKTDVDSWCSSNNWLVSEHLQHQKSNRDINAPVEATHPSQDCEVLLEKLFNVFKDQPIGWGRHGWGYRGWKNPSSRPQHKA
mmetsp:Transcript_16474/g.19484  ORF Transcript_16474/g.19484 Transcript_16474/m.19484 type:complete len:417 (-) Transcript_16474:65-1315(-)|eukprot:CAMPEP_0114342196 /NCGR_PEP_ID=MMETSP0101-20121206/9616_1 /TAXON_ID=38822 ORGANISM="Pteridomonas danica, Strain PT" /NCGR_SAMPLE_ID=MMETSP0101 /ASSEMBLY_ACC=CAM_ASM_000211 /LENGTH=416 /DNA_ID=CAMNT_0001476179 /DNA_START=50 /DNA_END=1300 /DNA_ORIENTATION=+